MAAPKERCLLPQSQTFDAIYDAHSSVGHLKAGPTHKEVQKKYANVTLDQCKKFVLLCPVCNSENPVIQPKQGAKQPITSQQFRDRFQIDLIDMRKRRKKNIYGVTQRWLMTVKDHLSRLTAFMSLPRKRPKYVAHELSILFGLLGFPHIFHTDNVKSSQPRKFLCFSRSCHLKPLRSLDDLCWLYI